MFRSINEHDSIIQARQMDGESFTVPWMSFAEFFTSRISDPLLVHRNFLTYYDDDQQIHRTYTYAEFGALVERVATFLHDRLGLTRGDRVATALFNHDLTVILYFAAWTRGIAVVPINIEEPAEKKHYILEHSEVSAVFCWHDSLDELTSLQSDLPALRHVIALNEKGFLEGKGHVTSGLKQRTPTTARPSPRASRLDDDALIVYTSGTTG